MSPAATVAFCRELVIAVPELAAQFVEDELYYGEVIPHGFFGEVSRFAVAQATLLNGRDALNRLLLKLEDGLASGDPDVDNLIAVSFVENLLSGEDEARDVMVPMMPERLRELHEHMLSWTSPVGETDKA